MLQIRLLGQFDVRLDGRRIVIAARAGQSLFAYLALTAGTLHRREKLAGLFWPDVPDEKARTYLRHELWRIRKAIPARELNPTDQYLIADEYTLTFNRHSDYWLDVAILERPDLDLESLTSSLSLYQGELLPGFYDEWILLERERIQTVFESKMNQLVDKLVEAERWTAVQEQSERWLALGTAAEPAYRALMLSYSARGDMAKVSSTYQRCVDDLQDKFGVETSTETRTLYNGLLRGAGAPRRVLPAQPSGTVTFLFTDIQGSTRLLDKLGGQYAAVLAEHHEILRVAIQKWNGKEMDTQGDAFFVTFARALDAVQCAAEAQRALAAHPWLLDEPVRVRMGLHTGEPLIASTGYVGMDVHRAARIGDAGHGGQVLISQTTRELVRHDLPPGITIQDLGEHRLKDMKYPTPIYQLVIEGLPAEFPALKTKFTGTEAPTPGEPPFKGLQFFDEEDSSLFFGRELLTAKLANRLRDAQFLSVIIGASGSGKSSLVRAGLIPALKKGQELLDGTKPPEGSANWQLHVITPTAHPLEALAVELTRDSESVTATATLLDDLTKEPRSLALFLLGRNPTDHTLLVIDQFEELFTLCREEFEREAFIDNLLSALTPAPLSHREMLPKAWDEGRLTLVITLRADFYAHLAQYPELRDAVAKQQEYIGPMTTEELRRAIEEPAKRGHWEFEPGLVDLILRDVGDEPGALPLLSHALLETWKRRAGHTLTLKGYADAGGVRGAIAQTAESAYQNLSPDEQAIGRDIFLRLTELGEGTEDTRRRASFQELMSQTESADERSEVRAVLNRLADARLITLGEHTAEVAHEALIREWPTLREWLNQDREGLRLHRHLTEAAYEWELLGRDPGALYRGAHLAQAREWAALHPNALNAGEYAFLQASIALEQQEEQERLEQQRRELEAAQKLADTERARAQEQAHAANRLRMRNRVISGVGLIAVVLAVLAGVFAIQSNRNTVRAENEKALATSRELALAANSNLDVDPELSILLSLQALSVARTSEAESALHSAVQASRVQLTLKHDAEVWNVEYSPDGTRLATSSGGGDEGVVKIWDVTSGEEIFSFLVPEPWAIKFNSEGTRLAIGSAETAGIWDAATGKKLLTLLGHTAYIQSLAFSPDETLLATASEDHTAKVWDLATGREIFTLTGHPDIVSTVEFSPDGTRLLTSSWDTTTKVWDLATGKELFTLPGVSGLYSPDGTWILAGYTSGSTVWDAATGEMLTRIPDLIGGASAFSPNGTQAIQQDSGEIRIWDLRTGEVTLAFPAHVGPIYDVGVHPDGIHLATGSVDGTAKIWDLSPQANREWLTLADVGGPTYSPDGKRLATVQNNMAIIWDAETGQELVNMRGHTDVVSDVVFNPNGSRLATCGPDLTVRVWDAKTGKELLTLSKAGHGDGIIGAVFSGIMAVAYSPDGKRLASAGADGTAIIWDASTGQPLLTLSNQGIGITNLAFSPDGTRLVTAAGDAVPGGSVIHNVNRVWDTATGKELFNITTSGDRVFGLAFSPDGNRLATGNFTGLLQIWDTQNGQQLLSLPRESTWIGSVAFSPDGSLIASGIGNGITKLYDASNGSELLTLHTNSYGGLAFSPDGTRLATDGENNTVRVYLLNIDELIALAESRLTRSLTTAECQRYLHVEECPPNP